MKKPNVNPPLDIGQISKQSGLPASALRFYEEKGLIRSTGRHGLRRLFSPQTLEQLAFIALARNADFSLQDISAMLDADGQFRIDRKLLLTKAANLGNTIRQLLAVQNLLEHVAKCHKPNQFNCPKFQRLLRIASRSQRRSRSTKRSAHSS
jgi:DNA-binding transcriptional MerR regulator